MVRYSSIEGSSRSKTHSEGGSLDRFVTAASKFSSRASNGNRRRSVRGHARRPRSRPLGVARGGAGGVSARVSLFPVAGEEAPKLQLMINRYDVGGSYSKERIFRSCRQRRQAREVARPKSKSLPKAFGPSPRRAWTE